MSIIELQISEKVGAATEVEVESDPIADGNNWQIATAAHEDEIKELLTEGFEPYSVDQGIYYLKKKGT